MGDNTGSGPGMNEQQHGRQSESGENKTLSQRLRRWGSETPCAKEVVFGLVAYVAVVLGAAAMVHQCRSQQSNPGKKACETLRDGDDLVDPGNLPTTSGVESLQEACRVLGVSITIEGIRDGLQAFTQHGGTVPATLANDVINEE